MEIAANVSLGVIAVENHDDGFWLVGVFPPFFSGGWWRGGRRGCGSLLFSFLASPNYAVMISRSTDFSDDFLGPKAPSYAHTFFSVGLSKRGPLRKTGCYVVAVPMHYGKKTVLRYLIILTHSRVSE